MKNSFAITLQEIKTAYSHTNNKARRIYYEYVSTYRRITVLENGKGYEICVSYIDIAKEYNKTWATCWGKKEDALAWAKAYARNRNIYCGILTIIEKQGRQII